MNLIKLNAINPDDWGIIHGISWINSPEAVVNRSSVPYVDIERLRKTGFVVRFVGGGIHVQWGKRTARLPMPSQGRRAGVRAPFKSETGRTYVPALELHRQGVVEVQVLRGSQMLDINLAPPAESDRNVELPFRNPLP